MVRNEDIHRSHQAGFAAHVTKPVSREALVAVIASVAAEERTIPSDASAATPPPGLAVFDGEAALKRCLGKQELLDELIEFFYSDFDKILPQIRAALESGDLTEVGNLGHRLKGTLTLLLAERAREAAVRVEPASGPMAALERGRRGRSTARGGMPRTKACPRQESSSPTVSSHRPRCTHLGQPRGRRR